MTNKDAIYILSGLKRSLNEYCGLNNNGQKAFDMAISALQAQEVKTQLSAEGTTSDLISRQAAIETARTMYERCDTLDMLDYCNLMLTALKELPSAQPEPLSDAYTKAVWTWLLDYQIKAAELKGRYTPYEVLSWVANDWRKEHEGSDKQAGGD
jgi:hypothetical protein